MANAGALTERSGTLVLSVATLVVGLSIAFASGWKLTLVLLAVGPLIGLSGWAQGTAITGFSRKAKKLYEDSSQVRI
jgi:ATP-binding cassette subfamily B (MDR/TAP) protein 1